MNNLEELLNQVAESTDINETIENLSKAVVSQYDSFNPEAIPKEYQQRQISQKRPKEFENDIEQMKNILRGFRAGKAYPDLYKQAARVVAGNTDIFTNVQDYMEKVYKVEVTKKEPEEEPKKEVVPEKEGTRVIRTKAEGKFLSDVDAAIKDLNIQREKNEVNLKILNGFSFKTMLKEIEKDLKQGLSKEVVSRKMFKEFGHRLLHIIKEEARVLVKKDISLRLPSGKLYDFEVKSNNNKSKTAVLKYTQQFRISRSSSIKDFVDEGVLKEVISVHNMVIRRVLDSAVLKEFNKKLNRDKCDLLTRIGGEIVVVNKNDYFIEPTLAKSETAGDYILFQIRVDRITTYKRIKEWLDDRA